MFSFADSTQPELQFSTCFNSIIAVVCAAVVKFLATISNPSQLQTFHLFGAFRYEKKKKRLITRIAGYSHTSECEHNLLIKGSE